MKNNFFRFIILIFAFVAVIGLLVGVSKATTGGGSGSDTTSKNDDTTIVPESTDPPESEVFNPEDTEEGHIHEWGEFEVVTAATCAKVGLEKALCSGCAGYKTQTIPKLTEHDFDEGVVSLEPTCAKVGKLTKTCSVCNFKKFEDVPKLTTHTFNTAGICTICGSSCSHKWGEYSLSTSDTTKHERQCSVCKSKQTSGHNFADGVCRICDYECKHIWNDGEVTKYPDCVNMGITLYTCSVCSDTREESIGVTDHDYVGNICSICGGYSDTCFNEDDHGNYYEYIGCSRYESGGGFEYTLRYYCDWCGWSEVTTEYGGSCLGSPYCGGHSSDEPDSVCSHSNSWEDGNMDGCLRTNYYCCGDCGATFGHYSFYDHSFKNGVCSDCGATE